MPENPDGMNPEETEKLPSAEETPEIPADPAGDETSEPPADNPAGDESPEETPTETPPSGSGEDSPSTDNGENTPPSGTTEAGSPADPPAGDGQAAEQPSAKARLRTAPGRTGYAPTTRSIQRTAAMRRQMKPMRKNLVHMTANSAPSKKRFPPCRKASRQRIKKRYRHRLMKLPRSLQLWQRAKARMFSIFPHMKT